LDFTKDFYFVFYFILFLGCLTLSMIGQRDVYESAMVKSLSKSAAAMQIEQFRESIYYYCERSNQNYMGLLCRHQIVFRAAQNLFPVVDLSLVSNRWLKDYQV